MKKNKAKEQQQTLEKIKSLALQALFSDDELLRHLVFKGGSAMSMVHHITSRDSIDLDFSLEKDFSEDPKPKIESALRRTFSENGLEAFDINFTRKPHTITPDIAGFWGGYALDFKIISTADYAALKDDHETVRRNAINFGNGTKVLVEMSCYEFTKDKEQVDFEGLLIYVYSLTMIVCEKLRAICQQMPEYAPIVHRSREGGARARDFFDIHLLVTKGNVATDSREFSDTLKAMFEAKRVPMAFLDLVVNQREFHRTGYASLKDTVSEGIEEFDFYFNYTLDLIGSLKPLWDE